MTWEDVRSVTGTGLTGFDRARGVNIRDECQRREMGWGDGSVIG